jgi:hypothetical protein
VRGWGVPDLSREPGTLLMPSGSGYVVKEMRPLTKADRVAVACYVQHVNAGG